MAATPEAIGRMSAEQYLAFESAQQDIRHELVDGWLYAMVGATLMHERVAGNLFAALVTHLAGGPCRAYKSDVKLRLGDDFFYPDIIVRCGDDSPAESTWLDDADVIIEVLSPSTQRYDRGDKRVAYWGAPSLSEYITIAQHDRLAERQSSRDAEVERIEGETDLLHIERLDFRIPLGSLYA